MQNKTTRAPVHMATPEAEIERLTGVFQALGDPARLRILNLLLHGGEVRNTEVEAVTGYGNSKISRHFAYLKHAGLVQDRRDGLSVYYALRPAVGVVTSALLESMRGWAAYYSLFEQDAAALREARQGNATRESDAPELMRPAARKPRVLFLCQHNAVRSQMAEALLKRHAGGRFTVASAGLASTRIHPLALQVLEEAGIPTRELRSKDVTEFLGRASFTYVVTLCLEAEEACPRLFPGALQLLRWPFEDVAAETLGKTEQLHRFRLLRDSIDQKIRDWLKD